MPQPLQGITVIDATHVMAGPFCTHLLKLLGARIIKIERPVEGDVMRHYERDPQFAEMAPPFMAFNAGKESITLNLKSPQAVEIIRRLAAKSDVLIENYRPGVMTRLGLGYDALSAINPRLVYCSVSGFGQSGPLRDNPAYDHIVQGVCGVMSLTGEPGSAPTKVGFPMIDTFTGYSAAFATLAALLQRAQSGRGQFIDVAMLDNALVLMSSMVVPFLTTGIAPEKVGNRGFNGSPTSDTFDALDMPLTLGANTQKQFEQLCDVLGCASVASDPRFLTANARIENATALHAALAPHLRKRSAREWETLLNTAGVPAGAVRTIPEVLNEPHLSARNLVLPLTPSSQGHTGYGLGLGFQLDDNNPAQLGAPPLLGEHTRPVLHELGYSDTEIDALQQARVI
jgi:CoA:oxalate CoA-transferase